jgi:arylsulfatase A-like enzyme
MNVKIFMAGMAGLSGVFCGNESQEIAGNGNTDVKLNPKDQEQPDIVIIYTDDMGVGDLSCLNNGWVSTPNIDRLAAEGIVMEKYYSAAPVSSPSRVGITTGMFPLHWGINTFLQTKAGNKAAEQRDFLDASAPTLARVLKEAGYKTGHFGKWHMGGGRDVDDAPSITTYGFDEYASTWESPDPHPELTATNWIWSASDEVKRWNRTAWFVDKTLDFMERHRDEPCFVNLWPDDMHTPWVPDADSQELEDKERNTKPYFRRVLTEYDKQIGRFLDELDRRGMSENTIVIFTSDNGPAPSFQQVRANELRGMKNSLYEGGILMPMIVRWPAKIPAGKVDNSTVMCSVDLLPSLAAIAEAELPKDVVLSGEDLSGALLGKPQERTGDLMWDFGRNDSYGRPGDVYHRSPSLAIRRDNWKLLVKTDGSGAELYDIGSDPKETNNLVQSYPALAGELTAKVLEWYDGRPLTP